MCGGPAGIVLVAVPSEENLATPHLQDEMCATAAACAQYPQVSHEVLLHKHNKHQPQSPALSPGLSHLSCTNFLPLPSNCSACDKICFCASRRNSSNAAASTPAVAACVAGAAALQGTLVPPLLLLLHTRTDRTEQPALLRLTTFAFIVSKPHCGIWTVR